MDKLRLLAETIPDTTRNVGSTGTPINTQGFCGDGLGAFGQICNQISDPGAGFSALGKVISTVIGFITLVAGIYFLFQIIVGGVGWMSSTGDKNKLQGAQDRMTNAFIGLVIVVAAYSVAWIVGKVLGIDLLLSNPAGTAGQLGL